MCASKKKNWLYLWLVLSFSYNVVGWSDLPGREFFHSLLLSHAHLIIKKNKKRGTYDKLMYLQLITLSQLLVSLFLQFLQWHSDVVCLNLLYGIYRVFVSHIEWKLLLFRGIFFFFFFFYVFFMAFFEVGKFHQRRSSSGICLQWYHWPVVQCNTIPGRFALVPSFLHIFFWPSRGHSLLLQQKLPFFSSIKRVDMLLSHLFSSIKEWVCFLTDPVQPTNQPTWWGYSFFKTR